jgi:hypothetical protein
MAWSSGRPSAHVGGCSWLAPVIMRGLAPSPANSRKVALVNCSCHWVTSLVGRFLQCLLWWARCVIPISHRTTKCWLTQQGLACWQAREPREKNRVSFLCDWISPGDWLSSYYDWFIPRHGGIITSLTPLHSLQTSCSKLFGVTRIESLLGSLFSSSGAL